MPIEYCTFTEPQQGFSYDDQLAFARATEQGGFDGFFRSDHYMRMDAGDPLPGPTDAWTTLAGLARETKRIRLGTLVSSATHRQPAIAAIQVAQVDAMSGGRIDFGIGTGWAEAEHRAYGIPFPKKRFDIFQEQLAIITGLWSTPIGETFDFAGEYYTLVDAPALPKPLQEHVPLIVGGGGLRRTPEIAARFATEFNIGFRPESDVIAAFARVTDACEREGRDPATLKRSVALPTIAAPDETTLARRAQAATGQTLDEFRNGTNLAGNAAEIIARVERLVAIGAQRIYFQTIDMHDLEQLDYLATEVLPHLPR